MDNKYLSAQRTMNLPQAPPMAMQQQVMMKQQMLAGFGVPKAAASKKDDGEKTRMQKLFSKESAKNVANVAIFTTAVALTMRPKKGDDAAAKKWLILLFYETLEY